jgi:hypothetical protein
MADPITLTDEELDKLISSLTERLGLVDTDPIDAW